MELDTFPQFEIPGTPVLRYAPVRGELRFNSSAVPVGVQQEFVRRAMLTSNSSELRGNEQLTAGGERI